jgi:hypothetical protein
LRLTWPLFATEAVRFVGAAGGPNVRLAVFEYPELPVELNALTR